MEGQRRILDLCVDAGETLLANGAEIYRVQQTMEIIARSYGARSFHVYVLTNGLFASMEDGGAVQSAAVRLMGRESSVYGKIDGSVIHVAPDSTLAQDGRVYYLVRVEKLVDLVEGAKISVVREA